MNEKYLSLFELDNEELLNLYNQSQLLMCLRGAQENEKGNSIKMWADFGRFYNFRVNKLIYKIKNDTMYANGVLKSFDESSDQWLEKFDDRLKYIKENFFGQGSGFWWHSIESGEFD